MPPLSCLGPAGIFPFLGAWSALDPCPFSLGKVPGLGVEAQKNQERHLKRPRWDAVCTGICKCKGLQAPGGHVMESIGLSGDHRDGCELWQKGEKQQQ